MPYEPTVEEGKDRTNAQLADPDWCLLMGSKPVPLPDAAKQRRKAMKANSRATGSVFIKSTHMQEAIRDHLTERARKLEDNTLFYLLSYLFCRLSLGRRGRKRFCGLGTNDEG